MLQLVINMFNWFAVTMHSLKLKFKYENLFNRKIEVRARNWSLEKLYDQNTDNYSHNYYSWFQSYC